MNERNSNSAFPGPIEVLQGLLHLEREATDHYASVLGKLAGQGDAAELERGRREHEEAAQWLAARVKSAGGSLEQPESLQHNLALLVEVAGDPMEDPTAFKALKQGEEQTITSYENALERGGLDEETLRLIRERLLPQAKQRLPMLARQLVAA